MTLLVDASALVALMRGEPEREQFEEAMAADASRLTTAVSVWEAAMAVARLLKREPGVGLAEVERFCSVTGVVVAPIADREAAIAIAAQSRYGRGSGHAAKLNMGDCFSYAVARVNGARLLYKGNDFAQTDLA